MDMLVTTIWWKDLGVSDSWSNTGDPKSHPTMGQLLTPSRQTEVTVLAASTTTTLSTIFPAYPLGSGQWSQAVFLWPSSEGRHWANSLKQNNSALLLHLSAHTYLSTECCRGNKLLILTLTQAHLLPQKHQHQYEASGAWEVSLSCTPQHCSQAQRQGTLATLINLHSCTTNREGRPSFSIQTGAGQQALGKLLACTQG